jgi:hypothetical protein
MTIKISREVLYIYSEYRGLGDATTITRVHTQYIYS